MLGLGVTELTIILVIVVVIFGANKIPQIATGLGKALVNFKRASQGLEDEIKDASKRTIEEDRKEK
ncbi:MAG: hypothetical protein A3K22_04030 [Deltaproteobacteria bacterium RBG_16_42_7]|nr:MAG: hypothetical protein A3K22_04030 [Deltaproteobacteria bacterium RBG_16_42_7]